MRRIAVLNQKGGVGKTTTTANLGAALALSGARVLLIDLDPQGHLSLHFGVELTDGQPSVYDVLTAAAPIRDVVIKARENATLLAADIDLAGAEAELVSVMGREVLLREALQPIQNEYDYILIDCPPSLGILTVNALVAANEVLIPLQAHFLALQGLSKLLQTVTIVRQRINPELKVGGIVLCLHEPATRLAGEVVEDLRGFLDGARGTNAAWADAKLFDTCIRRNIKLAESSSFGQTVFDYAPRSNGAADYAQLAVEMFGESARIEASEPVTPVRAVDSAGACADDRGSRSTPNPPEAPAPEPAPTAVVCATDEAGVTQHAAKNGAATVNPHRPSKNPVRPPIVPVDTSPPVGPFPPERSAIEKALPPVPVRIAPLAGESIVTRASQETVSTAP